MTKDKLLSIINDWSPEVIDSLLGTKSLSFALFKANKELVFSNDVFNSIANYDSHESFLNPSFDKILTFESNNNLIFSGILTLGNYESINTSIFANIYRKEDQILVIGGVETLQLIEQNKIMHQLNSEINKLQRDLLKKSKILENSLTELNLVNEELNNLNSDKDKFLSILAHDLKNQFNILFGFTNLLLDNFRSYDEKTIETQLNILNNITSQTYQLFEQVLTWAKSQSGKLISNPTRFEFNEECEKVIETIYEEALKKNINIRIEFTEQIFIYADLNIFNTVIRNLISNAIKFTNNFGNILVKAEIKNQFVYITISDDGVGISEDNLKIIFEIKEHLSLKGTNNEKGSGFGLKLCKELVENQGGLIWVESEFGKGSDFKFSLPLSKN